MCASPSLVAFLPFPPNSQVEEIDVLYTEYYGKPRTMAAVFIEEDSNEHSFIVPLLDASSPYLYAYGLPSYASAPPFDVFSR